MSADQISALINLLPTIVVYIVPGYIFLWITSFLLSQKIEEDAHILLKSLVISFIFINITQIFFKQVVTTSYGILALMSMAILTGFVLTKILLHKKFKKFLRRAGISRSFFVDIWTDLVDFERGTRLRLYLPSFEIICKGALRKFEEKGDGSSRLLILSNYVVYDYSGEPFLDRSNEKEWLIAFNTRDVGFIEILYDKNKNH